MDPAVMVVVVAVVVAVNNYARYSFVRQRASGMEEVGNGSSTEGKRTMLPANATFPGGAIVGSDS